MPGLGVEEGEREVFVRENLGRGDPRRLREVVVDLCVVVERVGETVGIAEIEEDGTDELVEEEIGTELLMEELIEVDEVEAAIEVEEEEVEEVEAAVDEAAVDEVAADELIEGA